MAEPTRLLFPPSLRYGLPLEIDLEYPDYAAGVSAAKFVRAENGSEYIVKGPSLTPDHPQVAANELIAAMLADQIRLPILDHRILSRGTNLFFASARMAANTFELLTEEIYMRCSNRSIIYLVVAFDVWLVNSDRHNGNLLARATLSGDESRTYALLSNDHSHCLVMPHQSASMLAGLIDAPLDCSDRRFVHMDFIRHDIVDETRMIESVERIESVADQVVDDIVGSIPDVLLGDADRPLYVQFLIKRRNRLRSIFAAGGQLLPNLRRAAA
jgi:hypothetical protein